MNDLRRQLDAERQIRDSITRASKQLEDSLREQLDTAQDRIKQLESVLRNLKKHYPSMKFPDDLVVQLPTINDDPIIELK